MASKTSAFEALRPFCIQLTVEQNVQNVKDLKAQISATDVSALQDLMDYVLFPLRFSIKGTSPKSPGLVQAVLECITYVLTLTHIKSSLFLQDIFGEICSCFPENPHTPVPEEVKLAIVLAIQATLRSPSPEVLESLYKPTMMPEMGFATTLLLQLAEQEKSRELRLEALTALECLLMPNLKDHNCLGELFASFLPGLSSVLTKIICGDPNQGHQIVCSAISVWCGAVSVTLSDESLALVPEKKPAYPNIAENVKPLLAHRNTIWVALSATRVLKHLEKITAHSAASSHWKVRLALLEMAYQLNSRCWNSLGGETGNFLQIIIGNMSDERDEVKTRTREILLEIFKQEKAYMTVGEVLSECLHSLAVSLPRLLRSQDDKGKVHTLSLLIGYLQFLGPRVQFILHSPAHLQRLATALVQMLELDLSSVKIGEERPPFLVTTLNQQDIAHIEVQQKRFRFFKDSCILSNIEYVCRLLGHYGDFFILTDHFLGLYRAQNLSAIIVLNQLVLGAAGIDIETTHVNYKGPDTHDILEAVHLLLEEYTDSTNWQLVTTKNEEELSRLMRSLSISHIPSSGVNVMIANTWKICLQLEGISCFAKALSSQFRPLLISALYPLLEKVGDPCVMISGAALLVLNSVSQACKYKDVNQLIEHNADYLASEVSVGLQRLRYCNRGAACVLHAMLENCGPSLLPLLHELVQDLLPALDQLQSEGANLLFPVLKLLVTKLGKWFPLSKDAAKPSTKAITQPCDGDIAQEMADFLNDHMIEYRIANGDISEEEYEDSDISPVLKEDADEEENKPVPIHIQITKEVVERSLHYLSNEDEMTRVQVLDILNPSIPLLSSHEDVLLTVTHKIWPCLVNRLIENKPMVTTQAIQVLLTLAEFCKDFIRQRLCKDVLSGFLNILRINSQSTFLKGILYHQTQIFKMERALLEALGTLCVDVKLVDSELLEVIDCCAVYLHTQHHKLLQMAAFRTLITLSQLDPDSMWLYLCRWQSPPEVPNSNFVPLLWKVKAHDNYTTNICKLLEKLQRPWSIA